MESLNPLRGVFAPITTPFDDSERVDKGLLRENIEMYNATGLTGYMPLGSNGEYQGLSDSESLEVLDVVRRASAPGRTILAGCGRESAHRTKEFISRAADGGMDMAFVLPPHYFTDKMTDEALGAFYEEVADHSPVPIVIYNAPKFAAGLQISVELATRLAGHPNILAMKNSSMRPNGEYLAATGGRPGFSLIAGNIQTFLPGLVEGAVGGVLSTATYLPEYCCRIYELFINGEVVRAAELHSFLTTLSSETIGPHGVAGVKLGMDIRGFHGGRTRLPLLPVPPSERSRIEARLKRAGVEGFTTGGHYVTW